MAICSAHKKRTDLKNLCAFVIVLFLRQREASPPAGRRGLLGRR